MQRISTSTFNSMQPASRRRSVRSTLSDAITDLLVCVLIVGFPVAFAIQGLLGLDENIITVGARGFTVALAVAVLLVKPLHFNGVTGRYLLLLIAFTALYGYTMLDKLILQGEYSLAPPGVMFGLFLGIGIVPSLVILLCSLHYEGSMRMRSVLRLLLWLNTLFISVALFNGRELLGTEFGRFKVEGGINQIYLGHMGVLNLYAAFFLMTLDRSRLSLLSKALAMLATALGLATVVLAGSRGPFVAFYVVMLYIFVSRIRRTSGIMIGLVSISSLMALMLLVDPHAFREMTGSNLLIRIFDDSDLSDESRLVTYEIAWENFLSHPFLGGELLVLGTYPHNFVLEILMATGLVGMALFLMMYLPAWKECLSACFGNRLTFFHAFFVHMSVNFLFSGAVWGMHMLWTALAMVLVLNALRGRRTSARIRATS